jgi:hypothetical protein
MEDKSKSFKDLDTIRSIMENSTKFLSLSGLAGVFAGMIALGGASIAFFIIFKGQSGFNYLSALAEPELKVVQKQLILIGSLVLVAAISVSFILSRRKALHKGLKMWTPVSKRLLVSMLVPLMTGGFLIIILYFQNLYTLIIPSMLIFYGLALVNASKLTFNEVFYLGLFEIATGLASAIVPELGILFWCFGFGFLHIIYGMLLYSKYEK